MPKAKTPNYMTMKSEDLEKIMDGYNMNKADFTQENGSLNRKLVADMIKIINVQVGKAKEVIVQDEKGNVETHNPVRKLNGTTLSGMMVEIEFFNVNENDLPYVQLGLQGTALTIPREVKCWIPKEFVDGCLKHTVTTMLKMNVNRETGKISYIPKQVPRFQYTVHDIMHIDELKKKAIEGKGKINR
jgi:hypothetical protein